jgi:hypothetical protein
MKDGTFKGVHWNVEQKKYRVSFTLNGKRVDGGAYDDAELAHKAYLELTRERNKTTLIPILTIEGEEWRDIKGHEGRYLVSNCGRVKNTDYRHTGQESLMTIQITNFGYCHVHLRPKTGRVHRLVWEAFIGKIPTGMEINHKDGNKQNNHIDNLEVVYTRENQSHSQQKIYNKTMTGCYPRKNKETWIAQISVNGKQKYLGDFKTQDEAHQRYLDEVCAIGETNKYSFK